MARCVLEDEQHIERLADELVTRPAPQHDADAAAAISSTEAALGRPLTDTQRQVAAGLLTSGQPLDLVVGVAGSGKTTTFTAVKAGLEAAGYRVLGTATSGQAARNLGSEAGVASRTVASLSWHLEHATLTLGRRDVVILDEGAMTTDADIGHLLAATARCEAKFIIVGDDRQLGAIGPAGALRALSERHPERTWQLTDNLRQRDPGEVAALEQLRARHVPAAVAWYARHGRLRPVPDRRSSVHHMVRAWAADVAAGRDSLLLAYRRDSVEALNQTARALLDRAGVLTGPEVVAPGGRYDRTGDRVVTLAPGPGGAWVTSQTAQVTAVDTTTSGLTVRTPDGRQLHFDRDATCADRLAHGYAMTAHRAQGATVDTAHVLDDGGGRELAYVTTNSLQDGVARLSWAWDDDRRHQWALDQARAVLRLTDLRAVRKRLIATIPPDVTAEITDARAELALHEASSGTPGDPASRLLARIARLEEADTTRREHLRANPQVLQQIREIDRRLGEQRRTLGRLNAALRQHPTTPSIAAGPQVPSRDPVEL